MYYYKNIYTLRENIEKMADYTKYLCARGIHGYHVIWEVTLGEQKQETLRTVRSGV